MPRKPPDPERIGAVLAAAGLFGDKRAAEQHGVTVQTIRNYRKRAVGDAVILQCLAEKKEALTREWSAGLAPAIQGCIDFIQRAQQIANPADPDVIKAVNGSLKILVDVAQAERVLDARFTRTPRADGAPDRPLGSGADRSGVH